MNDVAVDIDEPIGNVSRRDTGRVLVSVHGGSLTWGVGSAALAKAIPIAATMGIRVVPLAAALTGPVPTVLKGARRSKGRFAPISTVS